jgi:hypothetical protein
MGICKMQRYSYSRVCLLDFSGYGIERRANISAQERHRPNDYNRDKARNQAIFQSGDTLAVGFQTLQESKAVCEHGPFLSLPLLRPSDRAVSSKRISSYWRRLGR